MKTIKKTGGTQVAPKLTLRPLRATLRVGYLRCAPVLASVSLLGILYFACFAVNLSAQTTLSGDHVVDGDLNVGTTGTPGNLTVTGDALFSGTRMGIGVTPAATLHIKTSLDEANGALLLQRGYSWLQDQNYYLKMLTQSGTTEGILVDGYGKTMIKSLGVGSYNRTDYFSGLGIPFSIYNGGNALAAEFQTNFADDDRALIRFKSKNSTFMYMGVKYVPNGGTQYGFYNSGGSTATPLMVINDSTWNSNVGIGTDTPTAKLDVNGGVIVRGDLNVQSGGKISLFAASGTTASIVIDPASSQISIDGQQLMTQSGASGVFMSATPSSLEVGTGVATGTNSVAVGQNVEAQGDYSVSFGGATLASGPYSTAFGYYSTASGYNATAFGYYSTASGGNSLAFGNLTIADGDTATAFGSLARASGYVATAMGQHTRAESFASLAIGILNVGGGESWNIVQTDPLFEIGNGWYDENDVEFRRNAMTVLKNGKTTVTHRAFEGAQPAAGDFDNTNQNERVALKVEGHADFAGKVRMPRQGDILMGEFGNPE